MYTIIDAFKSIIETQKRFNRLPVTFTDKQKEQIKKLAMNKLNTDLQQSLSAQELTEIIKTGKYPEFINLFNIDRINSLYEQGKTWDAVRKLQALIENSNAPKKTLL